VFQEAAEVVPLAVEENAAEVHHQLGPFSPPTHPRAVEAKADEVAYRALDGASADVEVITPQLGVGHPAPQTSWRGVSFALGSEAQGAAGGVAGQGEVLAIQAREQDAEGALLGAGPGRVEANGDVVGGDPDQ